MNGGSEREHPLEPAIEEMRAMGDAVLRYIVGFISGLPDAPAADLEGAEALANSLRATMPEDGRPLNEVLGVFEAAAAKAVDTAAPGFLGYIPGGGLYASALAGFLGFATNRFVNLWDVAPALVQLEANVIRWMCDLFDFPPEALGILTSGGSIANLTALVTARTALLPENFLSGTIYTSEHAHHSVAKSAKLAGFPPDRVRLVACTPDLRIDVDELHRLIDADRAAGFLPFCIVANAGTTNTGAVDPLVELVALGHERRMWVHVDAAYGGFFQLTDRGRERLRGIGGADSITLDPHKGMFLPYGTGCLLVRDGARLRDAHRVGADYMQDRAPERDIPSFSDYSPELSRDFRGLRVWLPIQLHGLGAFRAALDEKLDLTRIVYEELAGTPGFEVPWEPELSIVAFRYVPAGMDADVFNRGLLERINASGRVYLSSTMVGGRFILRVCVLSHRTHGDRIQEAVRIIRSAALELDRSAVTRRGPEAAPPDPGRWAARDSNPEPSD